MGGMDHQLRFKQRASKAAEQGGTVARVDFDHGKAVRRGIVEFHAGADIKSIGARAGAGPGGQLRDQFDLAAKGIGNGRFDAGQLVLL